MLQLQDQGNKDTLDAATSDALLLVVTSACHCFAFDLHFSSSKPAPATGSEQADKLQRGGQVSVCNALGRLAAHMGAAAASSNSYALQAAVAWEFVQMRSKQKLCSESNTSLLLDDLWGSLSVRQLDLSSLTTLLNSRQHRVPRSSLCSALVHSACADTVTCLMTCDVSPARSTAGVSCSQSSGFRMAISPQLWAVLMKQPAGACAPAACTLLGTSAGRLYGIDDHAAAAIAPRTGPHAPQHGDDAGHVLEAKPSGGAGQDGARAVGSLAAREVDEAGRVLLLDMRQPIVALLAVGCDARVRLEASIRPNSLPRAKSSKYSTRVVVVPTTTIHTKGVLFHKIISGAVLSRWDVIVDVSPALVGLVC